MPMIAFPDLGMNMVHVDDVADGILLALDRGEPGEAYVLGGEITTMRELIDDRRPGRRQQAAEPGGPDRAAEGDDAGRARWSASSWASRRTCAS